MEMYWVWGCSSWMHPWKTCSTQTTSPPWRGVGERLRDHFTEHSYKCGVVKAFLLWFADPQLTFTQIWTSWFSFSSSSLVWSGVQTVTVTSEVHFALTADTVHVSVVPPPSAESSSWCEPSTKLDSAPLKGNLTSHHVSCGSAKEMLCLSFLWVYVEQDL